MPEGDALRRATAALRTALVGRVAHRFDAPGMHGPRPGRGRVIESVDCHRREVDITWDDGLVLRTELRRGGEWHLYRATERWRRGWDSLSVGIEVHGWTAACFRAATVETFRQFDPVRHPSYGPPGADIGAAVVDLGQVTRGLVSAISDDVTVADALMDPRVVRGVGSVFRSEILWGASIHPGAPMSRITPEDCADLAGRAVAALRASIRGGEMGLPTKVYGRCGRACERCGDTIGVRKDETGSVVYYCPGCQVRHDPAELTPIAPARPMDSHPAAVKFLSGTRWRRDTLAG